MCVSRGPAYCVEGSSRSITGLDGRRAEAKFQDGQVRNPLASLLLGLQLVARTCNFGHFGTGGGIVKDLVGSFEGRKRLPKGRLLTISRPDSMSCLRDGDRRLGQ